MPGETKFSKIEKVVNETTGDKLWSHVYFDNGTVWVPALWEQGFIAQQVVRCERTKYKYLRWDAADKTAEFIRRAAYGENIEALCYEYELTKQKSFGRVAEVIQKSKPNSEEVVIWDVVDGEVC